MIAGQLMKTGGKNMQEENMTPGAEVTGVPEVPEAPETLFTPETPETAKAPEVSKPVQAASTALSHDRELACQNCGAPLAYLEGESVITCPYCGTTTMLAGYDNIVKIDSHSMLPMEVNENDAISALITWLSKGFHRSKSYKDSAKVESAKGMMLPYWIVKSSASTAWQGKKKRTRTVGTGDKKKTETWWEPVSGRFSEDFTWPEYARENPGEFWGVGNIQPGKKSVFPDWGKFWLRLGGSMESPNRNLLDGQMPFNIETVKSAGLADNLVNGQITQDRAEANARGNIKNLQAKKAEAQADVLSNVDTNVNVNGVDLVYVPLWEMKYTMQGKQYNALVHGSKKEVLGAEYPVSRKAKIVVFDIALGIPAAFAGLVGFSTNGPCAAKLAMVVLVALMLAYSLIKGLGSRN
jgi:LSD1 subclass zinc finger protein